MSQVKTYQQISSRIFLSPNIPIKDVRSIYCILYIYSPKFLTPMNIPSMITACQKKSYVIRHFNFSFPRHIDLFHKFIKHVIKTKTIQQCCPGIQRNQNAMHLSTTSSQMNNIRPNVMLDDLGINPVIEMPWSAGTTHHPRTSIIKFVIVEELQQFLIFSHFVLDVPPQGNYSEMCIYDTVKNNEPSFCRHLNVSIPFMKVTMLY